MSVWWGFRKLNTSEKQDKRPLFIALAGFIVLLVASSAPESALAVPDPEHASRCRAGVGVRPVAGIADGVAGVGGFTL